MGTRYTRSACRCLLFYAQSADVTDRFDHDTSSNVLAVETI
jgi:hypothetical protein